jgi:hypothetical protein
MIALAIVVIMNRMKEKYEPDSDYFLTAQRPITYLLVYYQLHNAYSATPLFPMPLDCTHLSRVKRWPRDPIIFW